jgi:hypothetical protein
MVFVRILFWRKSTNVLYSVRQIQIIDMVEVDLHDIDQTNRSSNDRKHPDIQQDQRSDQEPIA